MPLFDYTASDREGNLSHGQIEAPDRASASRMLAKLGLFAMGVTIATKAALPSQNLPKEEREPRPLEESLRAKLEAMTIDSEKTVAVASIKRLSLPQRTWSQMDRALYLRQLQVMFEAGIPLYRSAAVLSEGREYNLFVNGKLKEVPLDLERGRMLSKALERSGLFTPLIISSVRLGEESGRLDSILNALSDTEERAVQLKRALISRLTYPAVVMVAMSVGLVVMGHVMSRVMASMPAMQTSSPSILSFLGQLFQNAAFLPSVLLLAFFVVNGSRRLWRRHSSRLLIEEAILKLPLAGPLVKRLEANSVAANLALLIKAGLPIDRGISLCAELVKTLTFRRALLSSQEEIRNGDEIGTSFKKAEVYPDDMVALIQAGELAGSLEDSLDTAARYCADQVERTLEAALAVLEPLLIGLLGIAIGAVLILTFVPIFSTLKDL